MGSLSRSAELNDNEVGMTETNTEQESSDRHVCTRCLELGIGHAGSLLIQKSRWLSIKLYDPGVIQRLVFDRDGLLPSSCFTCGQLQAMKHQLEPIPSIVFRSFRSPEETYELPFVFRRDFWKDWPEQSQWFGYPGGYTRGSNRIPFGISPNDPNQDLGNLQMVGQRPDYTLIKAWLRHCIENHECCQPLRSPLLKQIRVVDVRYREIISLPVDCNFLALSYVWGGVQQPKARRTGRLPRNLPLTIEHAITITQELGHRYLWVDSICIDQQNKLEKHNQIALMSYIYRGAFATIIALDSSSAASGIPGVGEKRKTSQLCARFPSDNWMLSYLPSLQSELDKSAWSTRAWTYQEGLLSHRRILFTDNQVHFVCNESACSEDRVHPIDFRKDDTTLGGYTSLVNPLDFTDFKSSYRSHYYLYNYFVSHYVTRQMTKAEDSLYAVSALLQRMKETVFPDGFLFGLPIRKFHHALLWTVLENDKSPLKRRVIPGLPSWSWVGWQLDSDIYTSGRKDMCTKSFRVPPLQIYYQDVGELGPDCSYKPLVADIKIKKEQRARPWNDGNLRPPPRGLHLEESERREGEMKVITYLRKTTNKPAKSRRRGFFARGPPAEHSSLLRVHGVILTLPCIKEWWDKVDQLHCDSGQDDPVQCYCGTVPCFGSRYNQSNTFHDFLWVLTEVSSRIKLHLLLLSWERGVAYRKAFVTVAVHVKEFSTTFRDIEPVVKTFWFG